MSSMTIRRVNTLDHWSYSAWSTWKTCAFRFGKKYVEGVKEVIDPRGQAAMDRGTMIHKKQEFFLKGEITGIPSELKSLGHELRGLKKAKPIVEEFWGVDKKWRKKDRGSWCVMKMDAAVPPERNNGRLFLQDLKSGREYDEHAKQGYLYASIGLAIYPECTGADVEFWYADQPAQVNVSSYAYTVDQISAGVEYWKEQGSLMLSEKKFLPTPTENGCKWCTLRSDKGGPCKAWKALGNSYNR